MIRDLEHLPHEERLRHLEMFILEKTERRSYKHLYIFKWCQADWASPSMGAVVSLLP